MIARLNDGRLNSEYFAASITSLIAVPNVIEGARQDAYQQQFRNELFFKRKLAESRVIDSLYIVLHRDIGFGK